MHEAEFSIHTRTDDVLELDQAGRFLIEVDARDGRAVALQVGGNG